MGQLDVQLVVEQRIRVRLEIRAAAIWFNRIVGRQTGWVRWGLRPLSAERSIECPELPGLEEVR
jgi:hypothetical protein